MTPSIPRASRPPDTGRREALCRFCGMLANSDLSRSDKSEFEWLVVSD